MAEPSPELARRQALVRDAARYSLIGGAVVCAPVALLDDPDLAIAIALGTLLGAINFVLLARGVSAAIDRTVAETEKTRRELELGSGDELDPKAVRDRPRGVGNPLRVLLALAVIAWLIWLPPARPIGLGFGVMIVLAAAGVAAAKHRAHSS